MFDRNARPGSLRASGGTARSPSRRSNLKSEEDAEDPETDMKPYIAFRPQELYVRNSIQSSIMNDSPIRSELIGPGSTKNHNSLANSKYYIRKSNNQIIQEEAAHQLPPLIHQVSEQLPALTPKPPVLPLKENII